MEIHLKRAFFADAEAIWRMQLCAFAELLEKYQDYDTSPGAETLERVQQKFRMKDSYWYFICRGEETLGAIRIRTNGDEKRISPLFILPEYRGQGVAQAAMRLCEEIYGAENWNLDTILQEEGNCRLYEKMGYRQTGHREVVNERLTLVFYRK